jgi:serine/threonine protein kinase/tetratricopeptide (TPR) repeat protein
MAEWSSQAKAIFLKAIAISSPQERTAYLDEACGGEAGLRDAVDALLDAGQRAGRFPESPPAAPLSATADLPLSATADLPPITEGPGAVIGPYKLLESIGEGGMGVVYMAEQTRPLRRKVALKIIKPGMDTRQVIARFEAERQALALMDHANIAKVFDAGATDSGRPYFVMELVRGIPITDYCDQAHLPIPDRLELFALVCEAVQHAHQKGIIHRDLKPSNILVTLHDGTPVPKVIDFGIAKATGQQLTDKTIFTGFAQFVGTPLYMSPEQAELSGLDIDTRADIYSLGVLLYELLTGTTPFSRDTFRAAAYDEICRIIREQEPPKPSTRISTLGASLPTVSANRRVDPRRLGKLMRGELDWIVMKALEKDRRRRYETANGLAADLRRHLNHQPVEAGPPSAAYRLRKFARRNRTMLAAAAGVVAALVVGTVVSTREAIRATHAEGLAETRLEAERTARGEADRLLGEVTQERNRADLARQEADRRATEAREVVDFLINDLIGAAAPSQTQGKIPTVDQVLARADEHIAQKFAGRPLIEASIRHALSRAYAELGQSQRAQHHAVRAVELRLAHLGPEHAETIAAQNALGMALIFQSNQGVRRASGPEAVTLLGRVLDTARKALGPEHVVTLATMETLAQALNEVGQGARSRALIEELLAIRQRVLGAEHPATLATMRDLAASWANADIYTNPGNYAKAKSLYEQLLPIEVRDRPNHPNTLTAMSNLAIVYDQLHMSSHARDLWLRVTEGRIRILGLAHPLIPETVRFFFYSAGTSREHLEQVRPVLEQALARSRVEFDPKSRVTRSWTDIMATLLVLLGRPDEAIALVDGLPEDREAPDVLGLETRTRLALVLRDHDRFHLARPLLEQTAAGALRLRKQAPKLDQSIEQVRGIAQFLLGRWPGLAPGISPAARPSPSFKIEAPFRGASLVADGQISPQEYGPAVEARFDGDTNPGRLWAWSKSRSKMPNDLSFQIHTAYTDRSLFLAFQVRDQFVDAGDRDNENNPILNDSVDLFINGDQVANDMTPVCPVQLPVGNREGFQIVADAGGHQGTMTNAFTNADWKVGTSRTPDGYIIEFEIPLALIDTRDGPAYVPATSGSELLVNFGIADVDELLNRQTDYAIFWAEDPAISPFWGGEDFWTVRLRLVPRPNSNP